MTLSFEEQNRIDNFKAQYNSIQSEIRAVNTEIEHLLVDKDKIRDEISLEKTKLETEKENLNELKARREEVAASIPIAEKAALSREAELNKRVESVQAKLTSLERSEEKASLEIVAKHQKIRELTEQVGELNDLRESAELRLEEYEETLDSKIVDKRKELTALISDVAEQKNILENTKQEQSVFLESVVSRENKIADREAGLREIGLDMNRRHEELTRKEINLQVFENRLRRIYKNFFPDLDLKI